MTRDYGITFFYYPDIHAVTEFYENVLGFELVLDQGGTLAVAGIHLSDVPSLNYAAELFREKQLRSVTANTRADGEEFLQLAEGVVRATVTPYPFGRAPDALRDLAEGRVNGAAVLEL